MNNVMLMVAELMALSARTAPKAGGDDCLSVKVISREQITLLADEMIRYGKDSGKEKFDRDGENVRRSDAVVLISLSENNKRNINCGACGYDRCVDAVLREGPEFAGPLCALRLIDLGIAVGSAVKTASILNADNRVYYRIGVVARKIGLIDGLYVLGIPISAFSKNIYFDRPSVL